MTDTFLDKAYRLSDADDMRQFYDDWAAGYETEVKENGYATPGRIAQALASVAQDMTIPVLDFGCGTGLSGHALQAVGFQVVDGMDLSAEMLAQARKKTIYRHLTLIDTDGGPAPPHNSYQLITATGVIGAGAAPALVFDDVMRGLQTGGFFAFSFNDHTLEDPAYEARVNSWCSLGKAQLEFREHGPHLPGLGMGSTVFVIRKT